MWQSHIFVDGWQSGASGTINVLEKATGDVLASVGFAGAEDVNTAAEVTHGVAKDWAKTSLDERAQGLLNFRENISRNKKNLTYWLVREAGATMAKAEREILATLDEISCVVEGLEEQDTELAPRKSKGRSYEVFREPVGVVSIITPFNAPLILAMRAMVPALASGNGVILKPDPRTAICGGLLYPELLEDTGVPEALVSVLPGDGDVGNAMSSHPLIGSVLFTGSTPVGKKVGETAGLNFKRIGLELGGNNPVLVLSDADINSTVDHAITSSFLHSGQICMAAGQYHVDSSIYDQFIEAFSAKAKALTVGDPWKNPTVDMGPIVDDASVQRIQSMVNNSLKKGALRYAGGTANGRMFPATVLADVPEDAPAWNEEAFGPVAALQRMTDVEQTLTKLEKNPYGLVAAVHSQDRQRAHNLAKRLVAGSIRINDVTNHDNPRTPMVGRKESGNMSAFGGTEMHELLNVSKVISEPTG